MPLYVYTCPDCEIELEELRPIEMADWPVECPVCHGLCEREISRFNLGGRARAVATSGSMSEAPAGERAPVAHGPSCPCCGPRRR